MELQCEWSKIISQTIWFTLIVEYFIVFVDWGPTAYPDRNTWAYIYIYIYIYIYFAIPLKGTNNSHVNFAHFWYTNMDSKAQTEVNVSGVERLLRVCLGRVQQGDQQQQFQELFWMYAHLFPKWSDGVVIWKKPYIYAKSREREGSRRRRIFNSRSRNSWSEVYWGSRVAIKSPLCPLHLSVAA